MVVEQLELVPDTPKRKRAPNPAWDVAMIVTEEMNPHELARNSVHLRNVKEMNKLKTRYDPLDVLDCWRNLKSDESVAGFAIEDAKLLTVVKGDPPYIERWIRYMTELPPIYESYQHDVAVQERADFLRRHGFHYGATDQPNRLCYERVAELGLL